MKKIKWGLPFKTMEYLESLTEELANNPFIRLMTAKTHPGGVDSVMISFQDNTPNEVILGTGAVMGAHAAEFGVMLIEREEEAQAAQEEAKTRAKAFVDALVRFVEGGCDLGEDCTCKEAYSVIHLGVNTGDAIEGELVTCVEVQED